MSYRYRLLRFPEGKYKAVTFSYDDGVKDDIRFAETMDKYGLKATFNINTVNAPNKLTAEQIKEHIIDHGHEVALHGLHHVASGAASPTDCIKDALFCRLELESAFDMIIRGMAYPDTGIRRYANGNNYETVRNSLKSLGIAYARTLGADNDNFDLPQDFYAWLPTAHHNHPKIFEYIEKFKALRRDSYPYPSGRWAKLLYIWGHSYEFERQGNWDHLEKICELVSGQDDVWYATNIEIYDYINAYNSLVLSADGNTIYNPTLKTIWFTLDYEDFVIHPGETLKV